MRPDLIAYQHKSMRILITLTLFVASCAPIARADTKGVIGGRVTDPQNAAVSQAMVVLTNSIDGRRIETATGEDGTFEFRFVTHRILYSARASLAIVGLEPTQF